MTSAKLDQLAHVATITAHVCKYDDMNDPKTPATRIAPEFAVAYLNADPLNALVVINVTVNKRVHPMLPNGHYIAVFRGAAETPDNFFYQETPLTEPDADGGDLDAETALALALDALCS